MPVTLLNDLPGMGHANCRVDLVANGAKGFVRTSDCVARLDLESGRVEWLIERSAPIIWRCDSWISPDGAWIAEIVSGERRKVTVCLRSGETGCLIWERSFPCADPMNAFFSADSQMLVVCRSRQTGVASLLEYAQGDTVSVVSPHHSGTAATRLDLVSGAEFWSDLYQNLLVRDLERPRFTGLWARSPQLGFLNLETGMNQILHQSPNEIGDSPVRVGKGFAFSWHSKTELGVDWLDEQGQRLHSCVIPCAKVRTSRLMDSGAGLALNINDAERMWWLGEGHQPLWDIRAKPYIYRVHRLTGTDVFVGTDGNGGRLFGFDSTTGAATLNLKPALGGVGDLSKVAEHRALVCSFRISKSYSKPPRLLILSMDDLKHRLDYECQQLVGTWQHGAVCRVGKNFERLAIIDLRND